MDYNFKTAAKLAGITPAMLDYLCRTKVILPSGTKRRGRGRERLFYFGDIVMLRALARLLKTGISVKRLIDALGNLKADYSAITENAFPSTFLYSDGVEAFFVTENSVENLNKRRQLAFRFVLDMNLMQKEVLTRKANLDLHPRKRRGLRTAS